MKILLTNDDGYYAPGLVAMRKALESMGQVLVVAPSTEQSGVSQAITFLRPLVAHRIEVDGALQGYTVDGTPADCVKLAVTQFCEEKPDLIISGINGGLNAGNNVLYSGTVGGAIEGTLFGIRSMAVSLEFELRADFDTAAQRILTIIQKILERCDDLSTLYNVNVPTAALNGYKGTKVVPIGTARYGHEFIKRTDPKNRTYYWATNDPAPKPTKTMTDLTALSEGYVTISPLHIDLTQREKMEAMQSWEF